MPQRAVEKQLKRRRLIHECMLLGINDNPGILAYLKRNEVIVSEKTMIKDRLAVRAEFRAGYERHADELRSDILAELDEIAYELQTIASKGDAKYNERGAALASKRETLNGKAKLSPIAGGPGQRDEPQHQRPHRGRDRGVQQGGTGRRRRRLDDSGGTVGVAPPNCI